MDAPESARLMPGPSVLCIGIVRSLLDELAVKVDHLIVKPFAWTQLCHIMGLDLRTRHACNHAALLEGRRHTSIAIGW